MTSETLIYPVADTLNLPMHIMDDGKIRGAGSRRLTVGGMVFDAETVVASDEQSKLRSSYLIRVHANIWLYMVVNDVNNSPETTLVSFDGTVLGIKSKDVATFGTGKVEDTMKKLGPALKQSWEFTPKTKKWVTTEMAAAYQTVQ